MKPTTITTYEGAKQALLHKDLKQSLYDDGAVVMEDVLLTLHGRDHRHRRMVERKVFRRNFLAYYESDVFDNVLRKVMPAYVARGGADLVELGYEVTMNLTADFAGIDRPAQTPDETAALLALVKKFSEAATMVHSTRDKTVLTGEAVDALEQFDEKFLRPSIARRLSCLAQFEAGKISEDDLPRDVLMVLLRNRDRLDMDDELLRREASFYLQAGSHSTANATVHALHDMFVWGQTHPDDWPRMHVDPLFLQRCVHESLRLRPASPVAWRRALCPVYIEGDATGEGQQVVVDLRSANRDKTVYGDDADQFNPHRGIPKGYDAWGLTFGVGIHTCLGRDLDGGLLQKKDVDPDTHQYGIVAKLVQALLLAGARPDPDRKPLQDTTTEREVWAVYPVVFDENADLKVTP